MPTFFYKLSEMDGTASRALEFLTLTAARSGEVRGMLWDEVDLKAKIWTIPPERMKAKREHRVPLSPSAIAILNILKRDAMSPFVFEGGKSGKPLSDMALTAVMRRMNLDAVPHGLRSSFRNWIAEETAFPNEVAEMALAHAIGNAVEAAYRRGDLFEKRRKMMDEWAYYLTKPLRRKK
jgi:integrase